MFRFLRPATAVLLALALTPAVAGNTLAAEASSSTQTVASATTGEPEGPALTLELNELRRDDGACRITFVAHNGLPSNLSALAYEMVLFGTDGGIERMTKFDFGPMPQGRTIVRRFNMPELDCAAVSRILINGVTRCQGAEPRTCEQALTTANRTGIVFGL
ncbi:hypothetical protein B7H23_11070 [Notoacmeibacter marinus]|uniref:Tat pathway signal protein n=1 Tax=Notoacmeibacter marinus TaxID=1876515 RepID=A0A231UXM4_9HYPH|nr:hypothetical protein [Notoacmeibacter marinus]OXT00634.1 hypothetical protein B7H23_11070 [Notoacmeibacter marinus]